PAPRPGPRPCPTRRARRDRPRRASRGSGARAPSWSSRRRRPARGRPGPCAFRARARRAEPRPPRRLALPCSPSASRYFDALMSDVTLPAATAMGPVHVTISDLERSVDYYRRVVGLDVLEQGPGRASLGANSTELVGLVEEP